MDTKKTLFATAILLLCALSANAYDFTVNGLYYNVLPGTKNVEVTRSREIPNPYNRDIVIPSSVSWENEVYQVTSISNYAFASSGFESVVLPNTLKFIGWAAFEMSCIKSITIPASVEYISSWAFTKCPYLEYIVFEGYVNLMSAYIFAGYANSPQSYTMVVKCEPFQIEQSLSYVNLANSTLIVPVGMKDLFLAAPGWRNFGTILEYIPVSGISLNQASITLGVRKTEQLTASILPENAVYKKVSWKSSDPGIAEVSQTGFVTAKSAGTATITVTTTDGGYTATCEVEVIIPVINIRLNKTSATLSVGKTEQLTASVLPENASNKNVSWGSSAPGIAEVSQTGLVTAKSPGVATITVTTADGGYTATCELTITPVTGMNDMTIVSIFLYLKDDQLLVNSPVSEIITVYSVSGTLMYTKNKQAGETTFPIGHIPNQLLIVKGSSGWVKKLIQNK